MNILNEMLENCKSGKDKTQGALGRFKFHLLMWLDKNKYGKNEMKEFKINTITLKIESEHPIKLEKFKIICLERKKDERNDRKNKNL